MFPKLEYSAITCFECTSVFDFVKKSVYGGKTNFVELFLLYDPFITDSEPTVPHVGSVLSFNNIQIDYRIITYIYIFNFTYFKPYQISKKS